MPKTAFPAKFPGTCSCGCRTRFPEGAPILRGANGWVIEAHQDAAPSAKPDHSAIRRVKAQEAARDRATLQILRKKGLTADTTELRKKIKVAPPLPSSLIDCPSCGCLHRRDIPCPW